MRLVDGYWEHDIAVDGIITDSPWSNSYNDFCWDERRYPDHRQMLERFASQQVRTILWMTACLDSKSNDTPIQKSANFEEAQAKGSRIDLTFCPRLNVPQMPGFFYFFKIPHKLK